MRDRFKFWITLTALLFMAAPVPVFAGWVEDGNILLDVTGDQPSFGDQNLSVVTDGSGGAIVVWEDLRSGINRVYAQRISGSGDTLWARNGVRVSISAGYQRDPAAVSDGAGGVIVVWTDYRNNYGRTPDIYVQRLDPAGDRLWLEMGTPVCLAASDQMYPCMASDGSGGAIIGWMDYRSTEGSSHIYAQRIDGGGVARWTEDGVPVCMANLFQHYPSAAPDGAGGAFFAWNDYRNGFVEIYAQKIDSLGAAKWNLDGVTFYSAIAEQILRVVGDGSGGAFVCWADLRGGNSDIFAQRIRDTGELAWDYNGVAVCNMGTNDYRPVVVSDGAGGMIAAWTSGRAFAQRVTGSGNRMWPSMGVPMGTGTYAVANDCVIAADGAGGAIVAWGNGEILAQRVDSNGAVLWDETGAPLCTAGSLTAYYPAIAGDGCGGAVVAWPDWREGDYEPDLYAQRVDAAGNTITATLLANYAASASTEGIRLEWTLSEVDGDAAFIVLRSSSESGPFNEIVSPAIERTGLAYNFVDETCERGATYWYRVDVAAAGERRELFTTGPVTTPSLPFALYQNVPNPFNPSTTIAFYLPERVEARLDVYDASGRLVRRLASGERPKGMHAISWDGRDQSGRAVGSGIYFCMLRAGKETQSRKLILLR